MQVSMAPFSCKSVDDALRLLSEAKKAVARSTRRGEDWGGNAVVNAIPTQYLTQLLAMYGTDD